MGGMLYYSLKQINSYRALLQTMQAKIKSMYGVKPFNGLGEQVHQSDNDIEQWILNFFSQNCSKLRSQPSARNKHFA